MPFVAFVSATRGSLVSEQVFSTGSVLTSSSLATKTSFSTASVLQVPPTSRRPSPPFVQTKTGAGASFTWQERAPTWWS